MENRQTSMLRRAPTVIATAMAVALLLCSCAAQRGEWSFEKDDSLPMLCMEVSDGNVVAMVGAGWKAQDGWIQVQLSGGSVPGKEIDAVEQDGGTMRVRVASKGQVETMDISLSEWRITGGETAEIKRVVIIENGSETEAQRAV